MGIPDSSPHLPPDPPPPRMSIAHLLLLTLTTAVAISMMNFATARWNTFISPSAPDPVMDWLRVAARLWQAGILGTELALAGIVLPWIVEQRPKNVAPGHWLVLGLGVDAVLCIFRNLFWALSIASDSSDFGSNPRLCLLGISELVSAAAWFGLTAQTQGTWQLVPILQGILNTVSAAGYLLMVFGLHDFTSPGGILGSALLVAIGGLGVFVPGFAATVLMIHDRVEQRPRDWLHALGATLIVLQIVAALLYPYLPPI